MTVQIDISGVLAGLESKLQAEMVMRSVSVAMLPVIKERIHVEGKAASGNSIGTYSNAYLRLRQRKLNRTADSDVIFSATRQMENDFTVVATSKGYGLGYNNSLNFDKAKWLEEKYKKKVFGLTEEERTQVLEVAEFEAAKMLNE